MAERPSFIPAQDWALVLERAAAYGVDPYVMAAVGWHETHWGQLGAGRPSSGGYIFGYGVPSANNKNPKYAGKPAQIEALAKRLQQWGAYLGHPVGSLSDLQLFAAGSGSGAPLPWAPAAGPDAWARSVWGTYGGLPGKGALTSSSPALADPTAVGEPAGLAPALRTGLMVSLAFVLVAVALVALVAPGGGEDAGKLLGAAIKAKAGA